MTTCDSDLHMQNSTTEKGSKKIKKKQVTSPEDCATDPVHTVFCGHPLHSYVTESYAIPKSPQ